MSVLLSYLDYPVTKGKSIPHCTYVIMSLLMSVSIFAMLRLSYICVNLFQLLVLVINEYSPYTGKGKWIKGGICKYQVLNCEPTHTICLAKHYWDTPATDCLCQKSQDNGALFYNFFWGTVAIWTRTWGDDVLQSESVVHDMMKHLPASVGEERQ